MVVSLSLARSRTRCCRSGWDVAVGSKEEKEKAIAFDSRASAVAPAPKVGAFEHTPQARSGSFNSRSSLSGPDARSANKIAIRAQAFADAQVAKG